MNWLSSLLRRACARPGASLGVRGERLAAAHLKKQGYRVLERNLCVGDDEADLIALDPDGRTIVIVEVKTRADEDVGPPEASVGGVKQHRINRLAARLQKRREYRDHPLRFDVIAVVLAADKEPVLRHIAGAFQSKW